MHPNKALKPDGMAPLFFLTYWDITCQAVTKAILESLNLGNLPLDLDHTFITLISKKKRHELLLTFALLVFVICFINLWCEY